LSDLKFDILALGVAEAGGLDEGRKGGREGRGGKGGEGREIMSYFPGTSAGMS
jgi:hypothetical protein